MVVMKSQTPLTGGEQGPGGESGRHQRNETNTLLRPDNVTAIESDANHQDNKSAEVDAIEGEQVEKSNVSHEYEKNASVPSDVADDQKVLGAETEETSDPLVVDWDGPKDIHNPINWPPTKKWANIAIISFLSLLSPLTSTMFAPGVPQVVQDLHNDNQSLTTFVVTIFILGFAIGPLVLAPLSELYGRVLVGNVCNVIFTISTIACALSTSIGMLLFFRFLAGCSGVAPLTNGGGGITDMTTPETRGVAMAVWAVGPLIGPMIGPVAGGFTAQSLGWRWIFWILAITIGVTTVIYFIVASETYAPVLLERKVKRQRRETAEPNLRSKLDLGLTPKELWKRALVRPTKLLFLSPICTMMSVYLALTYGILYLLFSTFTFVFQEKYGFSESVAGSTYVSVGLGSLISVAICSQSDKLMKRLANKHNSGKTKPEYRLPILIFSGPLLPCGLFIYGWGAQYTVHWIVPLLGFFLVGVGITSAFMCISTYLVDTYDRYAASAIAAATVLRSLLGAFFPLFGLQMYHALGLGWGNTLLGFLSLLLCPLPIFFYYSGERIRERAKSQVTL